MLALIDGDIVVYRVAWTTENEDYGIAQWRLNEMIDNILKDVEATEYVIYLSDATENGFRFKLDSNYKQNRKQPKPKHYEALKYYIIRDIGAKITIEQEADDALGIKQIEINSEINDGFSWEPLIKEEGKYLAESNPKCIICSIDKDMLQIPGWHYNFVKKEKTFITPEEGLRRFYEQLLMGDVVDNIPGIYGIGPVKARKHLKGLVTEEELFLKCKELYEKHEIPEERLLLNGRLLKIRTKEDEIWNFPISMNSQELKQLAVAQ